MVKYSINILWSEEDKGFIATVPEFPSLSAFGETYEVALKEAQSAVEGFIEILKEDGDELPEPNTVNNYSGQIRIRMPRELHRHLAIESARQDMSLNTYMVSVLSMGFVLNRLERMERNANLRYVSYDFIGSNAGDNFITQGLPMAYVGNVGTEQTVVHALPLLPRGGGR